MNKWKLSYIIHMIIWGILWGLSLFYQDVAWLPITLAFLVGISSHRFLMLLGDGTIPGFAWLLYEALWLSIAIAWLYFGIKKWKQGKPALVLLALHALLFFIGFVILHFTGSIHFPFRL